MLHSLLLTALAVGGDCTPVQIQQGLQSVVRCTGETFVFSVAATGSNLQYSWSHGGGVVAGETNSSVTIADIDLADRGLWCVTVFNECSAEMSCARLSVQQCDSDFCTLTQGAYGNPNGQFNGMNRVQLITSLLASGPITLGVPGVRSVTIPTGTAAANCVINRLPAGGPASALPNFGDQALSTTTCQTLTPLPLNNNGNFKNILLGQTLTLRLNTRLSPALAGTPLCPVMSTSNGPVVLPLTVLAAINQLSLGHGVDSLLALADRALAGQSTGMASLSDINAAVDAINRGFDECATLYGCL